MLAPLIFLYRYFTFPSFPYPLVFGYASVHFPALAAVASCAAFGTNSSLSLVASGWVVCTCSLAACARWVGDEDVEGGVGGDDEGGEGDSIDDDGVVGFEDGDADIAATGTSPPSAAAASEPSSSGASSSSSSVA